MISVAHFFEHFNSVGGVEAVLRQHYENDASWGLDSRFAILEEPSRSPAPRVHHLDLAQARSVRGAWRRLEILREFPRPLVAVYHSLGPMRTYVCQRDLAARRLLVLHGKGTGLEDSLSTRRTWIDGVVSVSEEARIIAQRLLPHLPGERLVVLPLPITSCAGLRHHQPLANRPVRLGFCGRLMSTHKRVDRLPPLCALLDQHGLSFEFEILGDGPERPWLERQLGGNPRIRFLGRRSGSEYRRLLSAWDFIVFVSDTEGQPVALLEAMSAGVLPLFPRINSAGDTYTKSADEALLYEPGALAEVVRIVSHLRSAEPGQVARLRDRCRAAVASNLDGTYFRRFSALARSMLESRRISTDQFPRYPSWLTLFPLSWVSRAARLRRSCPAVWRRDEPPAR